MNAFKIIQLLVAGLLVSFNHLSLSAPNPQWREINYYEILNVRPDATAQEIKKAYINLARTKHPDKGGDSDLFQIIVAANEILSDPARRQEYDAFRKNLKTQEPKKNPTNFELRNKIDNSLKVTVRNGSNFHEKNLQKPVSKKESDITLLQLSLDQNQPVTLDLEYINKDGKKELHTYLFSPGKAQFVSFENGSLRPQKGSWGKSQSGLPIPKNNVTQNDIDAKKDITVLKK